MIWLHTAIEWASQLIEIGAVAVALLAVGRVLLTQGALRQILGRAKDGTHERARAQLDHDLLLCLSLLVSADIVRTVTMPLDLSHIAVLGLLIVVRTALSWSILLEAEGCWPWQVRSRAAVDTKAGDGPSRS